MNPMSTFNPDVPCHVHDGLNNQVLDWKPEWAEHYRQNARESSPGVSGWDGRLLDGWMP